MMNVSKKQNVQGWWRPVEIIQQAKGDLL